MPLFSRALFPGFQRLFPSAGREYTYPRELSETVNFVKDYAKQDFAHNIRLRRAILSDAAAGVPVNIIQNVPEPDAGMWQAIVSFTLWNGSIITTAAVALDLIMTGSEEDPWGRWETIDRSHWHGQVPAGPIAGLSGTRIVPAVLPLTRGTQWRLTWIAGSLQGLATYRAHVHWVDIPGELIDVAAFMRQTNIVNASALN